MPRIPLLAVSLGIGLMAAAPALAANGETTGPTTMYDGPGFDFIEVVEVPAGTRLINHGCVNVEEWCRVRWGNFRGWVAGEFLAQVHTRGATVVAIYPQPEPEPEFDAFDDVGYIHSGAGYFLPDHHGKKFGHGKRGKKFSHGKHGRKFSYGKYGYKKHGVKFRGGSKHYFKLKPRGFLKLKPRGFLKVKPRGFLKLGH